VVPDNGAALDPSRNAGRTKVARLCQTW